MTDTEADGLADLGLSATQLLDGIPSGIIVRGATGRIVYANQEAHRLVRHAPQELHGKTSVRDNGVQVLKADGAIATSTPTSSVFETGRPVYNVQHQFRFPDGDVRWINASWLPILDSEAGALRYVVTTFSDITASVLHHKCRSWLREDVLQTLLGVSLVLEALPTSHPAASVSEDVKWAAVTIRKLAKSLRARLISSD